METKTIPLSEKEGKRYEIWLTNDGSDNEMSCDQLGDEGYDIIYVASTDYFLQSPDKEEIAEKVVKQEYVPGIWLYKHYSDDEYICKSAISSLMSAIGDYKYIIITETEI